MAEHLIQIAVGVDDEAIIRKTEEYAAKKISDEIMLATHTHYYGTVNEKDNSPLVKMIQNSINEFLKDSKEEIIEKASVLLVEKLSRTKKVKEAVEKIVEKIVKESEG